MRFLIDEMFGPDVAQRLAATGHDAVHVGQLGLAGAEDRTVLGRAAADDRAVVTENAADFAALLEARITAGLTVTPVVVALKRRLPRAAGAMNHALVEKLVAWAAEHPDAHRHVHWLP